MTARVDPIGRSLRSEPLRAVYAAWQARRRFGGLPQPDDIDLDTLPAAEHLALAEVESGTSPPCFRLVRVGRDLAARLGRPLVGERLGDATADQALDPMPGTVWAYRHALASGAPSYEFATFNFGDGQPLLFERLLLPIGRGGHATQLLVASLFSAESPPRPEDAP